MSDVTPEPITAACPSGKVALGQRVRGGVWKYFGAMFMEEKNGQQAVGYTRMLSLVLFVIACVRWNTGDNVVPDSLLYTLWGLLGLKAINTVAPKGKI
jgi:hypothetical protein